MRIMGSSFWGWFFFMIHKSGGTPPVSQLRITQADETRLTQGGEPRVTQGL